MQAILESGLWADLLDGNIGNVNREEFRRVLGLKKLAPDPVITELIGVVLPEQLRTLDKRIVDGKYDWFNDDITAERFPLTLPAGSRELALVHFNKEMTSEKVEKWAMENGYELALIDDLLAVGSHSEYKELQRQFPIVALGSSAVILGFRHVPSLRRRDSDRGLRLFYWDRVWDAPCRFLVRKVSKPSVT